MAIIRIMNANEFTFSSIADFLAKDTLMPVILCIGTDRVIGDALGPIAGELLVKAFASAWEHSDKHVDRDTYINSSIKVIEAE